MSNFKFCLQLLWYVGKNVEDNICNFRLSVTQCLTRFCIELNRLHRHMIIVEDIMHSKYTYLFCLIAVSLLKCIVYLRLSFDSLSFKFLISVQMLHISGKLRIYSKSIKLNNHHNHRDKPDPTQHQTTVTLG